MRKILAISALSVGLAANVATAEPFAEKTPRLDLEHEFRNLLKEFEPEFKDLMKQMQPTLDEALQLMDRFKAMDDPRHYQLPEVLPNGDIIIRRREDAPPYAPETPATPEEPDSTRT